MTGEDTAASMGVSVGALRVQTVIGAALMTGAAVSLSGIIGFLGMMIPNVLAQTVGGSRRKLIALSAWLGAVFFDGGGRRGALADIPCRSAGRYRDCLIGRTVFYVFVYQAFEKPLMFEQAV